MKKTTQGLLALLLALSLFSACAPRTNQAKTQMFAMDTIISLDLFGRDAENALSLCTEKIQQLERSLSVTHAESVLSQVNRAQAEDTALPDDVNTLLSLALSYAEKTNGFFDPTIYPAVLAWGFTTDTHHVLDTAACAALLPRIDFTKVSHDETIQSVRLPADMMLDFGAIAKGFAADELVSILKELEITSAKLDLGGSLYLLGKKENNQPWRVGIQVPKAECADYLAVIAVSDCAVVTSGGYQRFFEENGTVYPHILDPRTAAPAQTNLASVTIVAPSGTYCDALSTALFVMGLEDAVQFWRQHADFDAIFIDTSDNVYITPNLAAHFTLTDSYQSLQVEVLKP